MEQHKKRHEKKKDKTLSKSVYTKIYIVLGLVLVLFALYNISQLSSSSALIEQRLVEAKEAARPARVQLTIISASSCDDCYDINAVVNVIESTGVNVTSKKGVEFSSGEAKSLIEEYGIEKVPTVIVTGEIEKSRSLSSKLRGIGEEKKGAYIFTKLEPPFIETSSGKVRGRISLIHLKKDDCKDCFDLTPSIEQLSTSGLKFEEQKSVDVDSDEGKTLLDKYSIKKVPTMIMDKEAEVYPNIMQSWNQMGSIEDDGYFVMREISPPYYSVEEERVKGLISMTILLDNSCEACYNPETFHKPILQRMGVVFEEEKKVDISSSEGKALIDKYEIEKIPTILLKGDAEEYPALVSAWAPVGTVESDGTYVFRNVEVSRQPYKDLTTNEVVEPAAQS